MQFFSARLRPPSLLVVVVALSACTAGKITWPDGTNLKPLTAGWSASVSFVSTSDSSQIFTVPLNYNAPNQAGIPTFSFDPAGPASATNLTESIPEGDYTVSFETIHSGWLQDNYRSAPFHHSYAGNCNDDYISQSVPCSLYNIVLHNQVWPENCPPATHNGIVTTLPVCEGTTATFGE